MGPVESSTFAPGEVVPGTTYRVVRVLDAGGMSVIYEVEETATGKSRVLKALHGHLVDRGDFAERLEVEARTLARLAHPNIVAVVGAGTTQPSDRAPAVPFFVMEKLVGRNLREVLRKKRRLSLLHALPIATDVLAALEHAHANGVVHRDVKPDNIYLHRDETGGARAKLLDFGILGFVDDDRPEGEIGATVRYASPEQLEGYRVGPATDLYAVGVVLFEMLVGKGPFDFVGHDRGDVARAQISTPAPALDGAAPDLALPRPLVALIASALEKEPLRRPGSAASFRAVLLDVHHEEIERAAREGVDPGALLSSPPPATNETTRAGRATKE